VNVTEMYDPKMDKRMILESMPSKRSRLTVIDYNDNIYVLGGEDCIHVSGYGESQSLFLSSVASAVVGVPEKKTIVTLSNNIIVDVKAITLAFILSCYYKIMVK
jgi:hypothetical protein